MRVFMAVGQEDFHKLELLGFPASCVGESVQTQTYCTKTYYNYSVITGQSQNSEKIISNNLKLSQTSPEIQRDKGMEMGHACALAMVLPAWTSLMSNLTQNEWTCNNHHICCLAKNKINVFRLFRLPQYQTSERFNSSSHKQFTNHGPHDLIYHSSWCGWLLKSCTSGDG